MGAMDQILIYIVHQILLLIYSEFVNLEAQALFSFETTLRFSTLVIGDIISCYYHPFHGFLYPTLLVITILYALVSVLIVWLSPQCVLVSGLHNESTKAM